MPVWLLLDGGCADAETGGEGRGRKGAFLQSVIVVLVEAIGIRNAVPLEVEHGFCSWMLFDLSMISGFVEWTYLVRGCNTYGSVSFVF